MMGMGKGKMDGVARGTSAVLQLEALPALFLHGDVLAPIYSHTP